MDGNPVVGEFDWADRQGNALKVASEILLDSNNLDFARFRGST
jgi:hypothetical protein